MGLRGTNGFETRGRDDAQEEKQEERKPGKGGHGRRRRKRVCVAQNRLRPARGLPPSVDWTETENTRSTSRDVKLTSCEFRKDRKSHPDLAPSQHSPCRSSRSSLSSSSMASSNPLPYQQDSQKAQESEILHGYVFNHHTRLKDSPRCT